MKYATPFFENNNCTGCPRSCRVDRMGKLGACGANLSACVSHVQLHFGEEPCISGTRGSGTIFFSGCPLRCVYCQNYLISRAVDGTNYTPTELAQLFRDIEEQGAHNINLVTPTHYAFAIAEALDIYRPKIPVVYNTSGYEKTDILRALEGKIDVYLTDYKYAENDTGRILSGINDYSTVAFDAIREMLRQKPSIKYVDGIMTSGTIVRHLILPAFLQNSLKFIDVFFESFDGALLSLMSQYTPPSPLLNSTRLDYPLLTDKQYEAMKRGLKPIELKLILSSLYSHGYVEGYVQELASATDELIPKFKKPVD